MNTLDIRPSIVWIHKHTTKQTLAQKLAPP